jgi:hypothetical protein
VQSAQELQLVEHHLVISDLRSWRHIEFAGQILDSVLAGLINIVSDLPACSNSKSTDHLQA